MMKTHFALRILSWILSIPAFILPIATQAAEISSPDGRVTITLTTKDTPDKGPGCLFWSIKYKGRDVLADSPLGLVLKDSTNLDRQFRIVNQQQSGHDETWKPVCGERSEIRDHYNQLIINLQDDQTPPRHLQLILRAYNEGAAFRYLIPEQEGLNDFTIEEENTQFRFTKNHIAYAVYSAQGIYSKTTLDKIRPDCERPLTIEVDSDLYLAVAEAALVDYARMRLQPVKDEPHALKSMLAREVKAKTPFTTPWRVVMLADSPAELLEHNYLILNLNAPCAIKDTSWIKPGKVIREVTLTTIGGKACVDFAVQRGLQYVEFDAGWYGHEYDEDADATTIDVDSKRSKGPLDLHDVINYGQQRNIGIILYVNRRALEQQLDEILPLYKKWGVKGVKYGFVQVGSQKWTAWLHEAVRKAADYQLMVDVHDEYRPTGYCRTYPNLMTVEGVRGNECMPTAEENLILPFTRLLCGPADCTVCWYYTKRTKNTHAHQLATSVVFYSPWQFLFWYDRPAQYKGELELDFFKYLPTVWDQTQVIDGKIGEYITLARRKGDQWFVGGLNAVTRREMNIPLTFLTPQKQYTAYIYADADPEGKDPWKVKIEQEQVNCQTVLTVATAPNGGCAIRIIPVLNQ